MKVIKFEFINNENNITLLKDLNKNLGLNFIDVKKILRKKDVKVNGVRVSCDCNISNGDVITCFMPFNIKIIYEDENILLVDKPKHLETISTSNINSLYSQLKQIYPYCEPCNRLDTNTTGINVFALNKESEKEILDAFKQNRVIKKYYAVVSGNVADNANLRDYLVKNKDNSTVKIYKDKQNNAVEVITEYKLIKKINDDLSLIEITLHTGKTHQIRAHLNFYGIYILGDEKYGNIEMNKKYNKHTQILISHLIAFDFLADSRLEYIKGKKFNLNLNLNDFTF